MPHFRSRKQSLVRFRPAAAASLATCGQLGPAPGKGCEAPPLKPLGMLLPIGNRKLETGPGPADLDLAGKRANLLLTIKVRNAPESPDNQAIALTTIWGALRQ